MFQPVNLNNRFFPNIDLESLTGPSYGLYRGVHWASKWMKTNLASYRSAGTDESTAPCFKVGTGASDQTWSHRRRS